MSQAEERLDVLNEQGVPTGEVKARALVHRDGDWHRSFHLWIVREGRYVLLQRRSKEKDLEADKVDVSVGGHFRSSETLIDVVREVEEELGVVVTPGELEYLDTYKAERSYPDATDREFQETYVMFDDRPLEHYSPDYREVYVLYEVPIDRAIDLYRDGAPVAAAGWDAYARRNNALLIADDLIEQAREDMVERLEHLRNHLSNEQPPQPNESSQ